MDKKEMRYIRLIEQLEGLLTKTDFDLSRMATITAILHNKMKDFFWTGFYLLREDELLVGNYQGALACQKLKKDVGVCWAAIIRGETVIVEDVHKFEGHIACDSRSNSEIVIPLRDKKGDIKGCLDIDSKEFSTFDSIDAKYLEIIANMVYKI